MLLEVIATTVKDAIDAEKFGANRIELVTGIKEGGLTPSYATIKQVIQNVSIPVHVMIRPHSRSFIYDSYDQEVILNDIEVCKELGATGIVFGALTEENSIDEVLLKKVTARVKNMNFTFHRAIDDSIHILEAINTLMQYPEITHVLTSGGVASAIDGKETIKKMVELTKNSNIKILAGSGLSIENISDFIEYTNVEEIHFGSGVRKNNSAIDVIDSSSMENLLKKLVR
ncbi:copper homeostasis protein CutC [Bacillus sp. AFS017336]|uniref:copper homeostasis protein CutC n=1 Tax=Bacillus sp. AFS017336 TaxID=2033489 RepID=UPI000BF194E3|nr:copper homeostasis protein CutC [Bacillus sp. AFS017336]PEL10532.1 copper homeostasis protein [Bacillus sp. AFS017336]